MRMTRPKSLHRARRLQTTYWELATHARALPRSGTGHRPTTELCRIATRQRSGGPAHARPGRLADDGNREAVVARPRYGRRRNWDRAGRRGGRYVRDNRRVDVSPFGKLRICEQRRVRGFVFPIKVGGGPVVDDGDVGFRRDNPPEFGNEAIGNLNAMLVLDNPEDELSVVGYGEVGSLLMKDLAIEDVCRDSIRDGKVVEDDDGEAEAFCLSPDFADLPRDKTGHLFRGNDLAVGTSNLIGVDEARGNERCHRGTRDDAQGFSSTDAHSSSVASIPTLESLSIDR